MTMRWKCYETLDEDEVEVDLRYLDLLISNCLKQSTFTKTVRHSYVHLNLKTCGTQLILMVDLVLSINYQ